MLAYVLKNEETRTVNFASGGSLTYRAVTKTSFEAAAASARKQRAEIAADPARLAAVGLTPSEAEDAGAMEALFNGILICELGARHATAWTGVADTCGTKEAECTPDNVRKFLRCVMPAQEFYDDVVASMLPEATLKKGSGTSAAGTSAEVPAIATDAGTQDHLAPSTGADLTEPSAPT